MPERDPLVPDWFVERLVVGDLGAKAAEKVRARLANPAGLTRIAALHASNAELLAEHPAPAAAEEIRRRFEERARRERSSRDVPRASDSELHDPPRTLVEHLQELRSRLVRMGCAFAVGAVLAWFQRESLLQWLTQPFVAAWREGAHGAAPSLHFASPAALFIAYVRLAGVGGFVLSLPFILYQGWSFVAPGLYSRERRLAGPFVVTSCGLFALGAWFGWRFAAPRGFQFLLSFSGDMGELVVNPTVMVSEYMDFTTRMLLAFGLAAELPVIVFFLAFAGIVTHVHLLRFFRYFVVLAFVIAAVLTPPDPLSQLLLAVPLCALYGLSIGIAFVCSRQRT